MEVVTGKLVRPSSERLTRWIQLLFLFHLVFFVHHASRVGHHSMMELVVTFFVCGVWVPLCGLTGASKNNQTTLLLFSGIEYCLSVVTLFNILTSATFLTALNDGCATCAAIFDKGSDKCQYGRGHNKKWLNISQSDCENFPTFAEIGFNTFLMTSIAGIGCCAAFTARQLAQDNRVVVVVACPDVEDPTEVEEAASEI